MQKFEKEMKMKGLDIDKAKMDARRDVMTCMGMVDTLNEQCMKVPGIIGVEDLQSGEKVPYDDMMGFIKGVHKFISSDVTD
jgi:hypothetical protein